MRLIRKEPRRFTLVLLVEYVGQNLDKLVLTQSAKYKCVMCDVM